MPCRPFEGEYRTKGSRDSDGDIDMWEFMSLAKRLGFSFDEMKEISFVSLVNILFSSVKPDSKEATQKDIDAFF